MKSALLALLLGVSAPGDPTVIAQSAPAASPCSYTARMTASAANTVLIPADGTHSIRICFYSFSLAPNSNTSGQIVWGSGATCGTNQVAASAKLVILTGNNDVILSAGGSGLSFIDEGPQRGISSMCLIVSGASPSVDGIVRYGLY